MNRGEHIRNLAERYVEVGLPHPCPDRETRQKILLEVKDFTPAEVIWFCQTVASTMTGDRHQICMMLTVLANRVHDLSL